MKKHSLILLAGLLLAQPAVAQLDDPAGLDPDPLVDEGDVETPTEGELVPGTSSDTELPGLEDDDELDTLGEPPEDEDFSGDVDPLDPAEGVEDGEGIGDVDPLPGDEPDSDEVGEGDQDIGGYEIE